MIVQYEYMLLFLLFFLFSFEDTNFSFSYFVLVITILYNLILSESVFVAAAAIRRNLRNISGDDQKVASHSGVYIRSIYTIQCYTQTVTVHLLPRIWGFSYFLKNMKKNYIKTTVDRFFKSWMKEIFTSKMLLYRTRNYWTNLDCLTSLPQNYLTLLEQTYYDEAGDYISPIWTTVQTEIFHSTY